MLAEVLELRSLDDKLVDLLIHGELIVRFEVSAGEFLGDAVEDFDRPSVLYLGYFIPVAVAVAVAVGHAGRRGRRGIGARTAAGTWWRAHHAIRPCGLGSQEFRRSPLKYRRPAGAPCWLGASNGLFSFRVEVGPGGTGGIREAPCEQRIVDELDQRLGMVSSLFWLRRKPKRGGAGRTYSLQDSHHAFLIVS